MTRGRAERIAVLGAGSWGTALAVHLRRAGHDVRLWARDEALAGEIRSRRLNPRYLTDIAIPDGVVTSSDPSIVLDDAQTVVVAVPSQVVRSVVRSVRALVPDHAVLVSATKGIEVSSLSRMSQVIAEEMAPGMPVVVLSGPSFALEVARGLPTAVLAASADASAAAYIQERFRGPSFRLYGSDDVAGVEIGGALKNVIAIAAGVVEGLGLGHNSLAALITRGRTEGDAFRSERSRRPRADLYWGLEPQSSCRHPTGKGAQVGRGARQYADGRRRRSDHGCGDCARDASRDRAADRRRDVRGPRGPSVPGRSRRDSDGPTAATRARASSLTPLEQPRPDRRR
jgi:glycerol-3-phosphate dehydrogenase